jgi:2-dehydropantoate 2-reductase
LEAATDVNSVLIEALSERTSIIPLLNVCVICIEKKFGASRVLGGLCLTAVTLNEKREVVQLGPVQSLGFGERDGKISDRVRAIAQVVKSCNFGGAASGNGFFLASNAASVSLMCAPIGTILAAPGGKDFLLGVLDECGQSRPRKATLPARLRWNARQRC